MKVMYHCLPLIYQWPQIPENKKSRAVTKIMQTSEQLGFTEKPDQENVIELLVQSLELLTNVFDKKKPTKSGRKMTSPETRQAVWKFWHGKSTHSTLMCQDLSGWRYLIKARFKPVLTLFPQWALFRTKKEYLFMRMHGGLQSQQPWPCIQISFQPSQIMKLPMENF